MMISGGGVWAEEKVVLRPPAPVGTSGEAEWWDRVTFEGEAVHGLERGVELEYNLSWNGIIKAGELDVRIELPGEGGELVEATATGKSTGLARALWEYDFEMGSRVKPEGWEPMGLKFVEEDGKEVTTVETSFVDKGVRYTRAKEYKKKKMGEAPEPKSYSIVIPRMHDIASAILFLRSLDLADGDEATVMIVPYDSAYLVTFRVLGREVHKSKIGKVPAIKVDVRIKKIHRKTMELEEHKKFKKGTIWVSDDEFRMPLEIRAAIFVGDVRATITGREEL
ncbi:MAG: DUF3108 domain-containing protein [Verrucomicrobiota bacterium]